MERYGIRGVGLNWLRSYIENRQQFVLLGEHRSTYVDITCGVPQGLILGPKLFILYLSDISNVSGYLKFVAFAGIFSSRETQVSLVLGRICGSSWRLSLQKWGG